MNDRINIIGIATGISVSDLDRSKQFYANLLGMSVGYENEAYACLGVDGYALHLSSHFADAAGKSFCTIYVTGVDAVYTRCVKQGIIKREIEDSSYGMRDFQVSDPDGNTILIGERAAPRA